MFERILVPLDGSRLAECLLPHAAAMAASFGAQVTLLRVIEGQDSGRLRPADPLAWQMRRMEAEAYLSGVVERLASTGIEARTEVVEGVAAWRIMQQAEAFDLLVLSTHGRGGLAPWSAGGVAQKVMEQVKRSVLLARALEEQEPLIVEQGYGRIVALLDGSKRAEAILPAATRLVRHWNATLLLLHVVTRARGFGATGGLEDDDLSGALVARSVAEARAYLQRVQARLPVRSEVRVLVQEKVVGAVEAIKEEGDIVLASAHGAGCNRRRRFGSMVGEVIHFGSGPLLVYQDMAPEQIVETASERAAQKAKGEEERNAPWEQVRPERMAWHALRQ